MSEFETFDPFGEAEKQPRGCLVEALLVMLLLGVCTIVGGMVAYQYVVTRAHREAARPRLAARPAAPPRDATFKKSSVRAAEPREPAQVSASRPSVRAEPKEPATEASQVDISPWFSRYGSQSKSSEAPAPGEVTAHKPREADEMDVVLPPVAVPNPENPNEIRWVSEPRRPDLIECEQLGEAIEQAITAGDATLLESHLDLPTIADRMLVGFEASPALLQYVLDWLGTASYADSLVKNVRHRCTFRFLRVREVGDQRRLLFRELIPGGGVTYHEFLAVEIPGTGIQLIDIFNWQFGDWISLHWRRSIYPRLLAEGDCTKRLDGDPINLREAEILVRVIDDAASSGADDPLNHYLRLSYGTRQTTPVRLLHFALARNSTAKRLASAYDDLKKNLPDNLPAMLWRVHHVPQETDANELLPLLTRLEEHLGGDPYLRVLKGNVSFALSRYHRATGFYREAKAEEADLWYANLGLLNAAVQLKEYTRAVHALDELYGQVGMDLDRFEVAPEFAPFVQSDNYTRWKVERFGPDAVVRSEGARQSTSDTSWKVTNSSGLPDNVSVQRGSRGNLVDVGDDLDVDDVVEPVFTGAEIAEFAERIAESINVGDPNVLDGSFDYARLFERATVGLGDVTGEMERALQSSFSEGSLGSLLCRVLGTNGSFRLLRVVRKDGEFRPLFRIVDDNQGVNYYELALARDDAGEMRAIDIYYHTVGAWQSESLRLTVAALVASRATAGISPLRVEEIALLRNGDRMARMETLFEEGRAEEALAAYHALPKLLQRRPTLLELRLKYAQVLGGREYDEAVEAVETQVTDARVRAFMLLDIYGGMGRTEEAIEQVRQIDRSIGGDPYLWVMQGNLRHQAGETEAARDCYRRAAEKEPESPYAYYALLGLSLEEGDHAETARLLTTLEQQVGLELSDLSQLPDYRDFIASDEYRQWDESRSAVQPASEPESP